MENAKGYTLGEMGPLAKWDGKKFSRESLALASAEISFNRFPAGQTAPFVHDHKRHEEVYVVLAGGGHFSLDGELLPVKEGSVLRVAPGVKRAWKAGGEGITFLCFQAEGDLSKGDGIRLPEIQVDWQGK